jgi:hypothetical protein
MKIFHSTLFSGKATALFIAAVALIGTAGLKAQTVFTAGGVSGAVAGASTNVAATSFDPLYNNFGSTTNGITPVTFGNGFSMIATGPDYGSYNNTFIIGGTISGASILAGSSIGISYDFTLAKNAYITSDAIWSLKFSDLVNNPSESVGTSSLVASGTLSAASATFIGSGNYNFVSGVSAGTSYRAFIEVTYTGAQAIMPPEVDGMMHNTGFGVEGITIGASAIPEPSTYAAFAGLGVLGFAVWRRRKSVSTKQTA